MSYIKLDITPVAEDIVQQLREIVPVRTGRLKNSIKYEIREDNDGYVITLIMEDYFKWLKVKTKESRLPTQRELEMANPPLPKMNNLGLVKQSDLSPRAKSLLDRVDIVEALTTLDKSVLEQQIKEIFTYDKL